MNSHTCLQSPLPSRTVRDIPTHCAGAPAHDALVRIRERSARNQVPTRNRAMDIERARYNMVEQQIRPWEVLDAGVLGLFQRCPAGRLRARGVPPARLCGHPHSAREWTGDDAAPGGSAIAAGAAARARGFGARGGDGERLPERAPRGLVASRHERRDPRGTQRSGEPDSSPPRESTTSPSSSETGIAGGRRAVRTYDAIALTGAVYELDPALLDQLEIGGRLFAIVGRGPGDGSPPGNPHVEPAMGQREPVRNRRPPSPRRGPAATLRVLEP